MKRERALYGSKKTTDSSRRYADEIEYNDVESRVMYRLDQFAKRRKRGDENADKDEIAYSLQIGPYLLRHSLAEDREEQREIFKEYLLRIEGIGEMSDMKAPVTCPGCRKTNLIAKSDGTWICGECFYSENGPCSYNKADFEKFPAERPPRQQIYRPINHFNQMLLHFQGKEITDIPETVIEHVRLCANVDYPMETITRAHVKKILQKRGMGKYYHNIPTIMQMAFGVTPPSFTDDQTTVLRDMFGETQRVFSELNTKRINFLSITYLLYKFCEIREWKEYLPHIQLLKSTDKINEHDLAWKGVCSATGWKFEPTRTLPRCLYF